MLLIWFCNFCGSKDVVMVLFILKIIVDFGVIDLVVLILWSWYKLLVL